MEVTMADKIVKLSDKLDETPMQKLARIDAERAELFASLKSDALQKANDAVAELNALGFHYHLSEEAPKTNGTKRGFPSDADCPVCKFKTTPPHDGRAHKSHTEAFTEEELKQRGYVKVSEPPL
jgi:hypothetical protein